MTTLGLGKIFPRRREPSHSGLQTLSEMVEMLEPSPLVLQALSETVAWCLRRPLQQDQFRSRELDPSAFLRVPPFGESNIGVWLERKRESYQSAINAINANRSALARDRNIKVADSAVAKSKGRLLLYEPLETVTDGASDSSSRGFFDIEDAPPWDTWFLYSEGSIFSWVPEALVQDAQAGIDANPVDCIHWCDRPKL
jgi:hypothetical protein